MESAVKGSRITAFGPHPGSVCSTACSVVRGGINGQVFTFPTADRRLPTAIYKLECVPSQTGALADCLQPQKNTILSFGAV